MIGKPRQRVAELKPDGAAGSRSAVPNGGAGASALPAVQLTDVSFGYGNGVVTLQNVDLSVHPGEVVVLIGPSGCGKSTLLDLVAGVSAPTAGGLLCDGAPVRGLNKRVTYMTQRDTLLPWRTALDNAALPLEIRGVGKAERHRRAREALALTGLSDAEKRRPHQLSGGMRSRLALARVLLSDANIVLMDEPFAALDALRRVRLQQLLLEIRSGSQQTLLYVTHDLNEAIALGDRIILMGSHPGRILLERQVNIAHPREVARVRTMPAAEQLYAELWSVLESQIQ
jgi:NitT/TauT family transport system ATP-binding protein